MNAINTISSSHSKEISLDLPFARRMNGLRAPEDLFRKLHDLPGLIYFDSARRGDRLSRFSFLSALPFERIVSRRGITTLRNEFGTTTVHSNPLSLLKSRLERFPLQTRRGLPPFQGGAAGLFSYDLNQQIETIPSHQFELFTTPDLDVGIYDWTIAIDHLLGETWFISTGLPELNGDAQARRAESRFALISNHLESEQSPPFFLPPPRIQPPAPLFQLPKQPDVLSSFEPENYLSAIQKAVEYIHAGDVYQVNIAQQLLVPQRVHPVDFYLQLRHANSAPFAGYFQGSGYSIVSSSPERFLKVNDKQVETRPIKGTRPRWFNPEADMYSSGELMESDKDRAENVMIVDLLRNDLGRVCDYRSIQVSDPLRLESYEFVHHLVSEVRGTLRADRHPVDLLQASFPGGSITGAPKIRAMEIIAEIEPFARGPYCGSLGYIGFDQSMDSNILIRTFTIADGWMQFPVGGGIVADSKPRDEYDETLHKAEGMIRALRLEEDSENMAQNSRP